MPRTNEALDPRKTLTHATPATMLGRLLASVHRRRERARRYDQVFAELAACSDRQLTDLGLRRADIRDIAREAADAA